MPGPVGIADAEAKRKETCCQSLDGQGNKGRAGAIVQGVREDLFPPIPIQPQYIPYNP